MIELESFEKKLIFLFPYEITWESDLIRIQTHRLIPSWENDFYLNHWLKNAAIRSLLMAPIYVRVILCEIDFYLLAIGWRMLP